MKTQNLIIVAGAAVMFCSCIPSVNPFYTDKDVVFDNRLLGEWREKDSKEEPQVWKFEKADDKAYKLTVIEKGNKEGKFSAHLFKLKDHSFLDLIPTDCNYATNQADLVGFSMFPGHLLFRVSQFEPELKLAAFDFDWLEKYLKKNPKALAHHMEDDSIVLTAGTRDLQKFVLKHLVEGELFNTPGVMVRKTNDVPATAQPK
jgi:hypothetical protein